MLKDSILSLALAGVLMATPLFAADTDAHSYGDHSGGELVLSLDAGEKWATDPPLRSGMTEIRDAVTASSGEIQGEAPGLADEIEGSVTYIIENCNLPLEADLQLHSVLEHLFVGIEQLRTPGEADEGMNVIVESLNAYGEHFEHEGWQSLDL